MNPPPTALVGLHLNCFCASTFSAACLTRSESRDACGKDDCSIERQHAALFGAPSHLAVTTALLI
jgi:hypothetical protein